MIYNKTAFGQPYKVITRMQNALTQYLFGSCDSDTQPFRFQVNEIAVNSNVATANVTIISGGNGLSNGVPLPIPTVGAIMGVQGLSSANGNVNVDPGIVSNVSLNSLGVGTISFTSNVANISATPDSGILVVQPYEFGDTVNANVSSAPLSLIFTPDDADNSRCLLAEAVWIGTMPTTANVVLEGANKDLDSRYYVLQNNFGVSTTGSVAQSSLLSQVAGGHYVQNGAEYSFAMFKFVRAKVLTYTGGDATTKLIVTIYS
jgi:hypothetical protein